MPRGDEHRTGVMASLSYYELKETTKMKLRRVWACLLPGSLELSAAALAKDTGQTFFRAPAAVFSTHVCASNRNSVGLDSLGGGL